MGASEDYFRYLVEQASDGIFTSDAEGRYLDVNAAACEILGYSREELLGMSIADVIAPEETPRLKPEIALPTEKGPVKSEWRFRRKDGSLFQGEVNVRRLPDDRLLAFLRDVTERRRVEDELRSKQRFIEAVARASSPFIYVFDMEALKVTYRNRSIREDLAYDGEAADRLEEFQRLMPLEEVPHLQRVLAEWRDLSDDRVREDEYCLRHADGSHHWFQGRETVFARHPDGSVRQILGTLYDITERKRAGQSLENSRSLLQSFVEHTPAAVAMLDKDLRYVAVSRRWLQDYQLGERDLRGQHHYDVFPEIRAMPEWQHLHRRSLAGAVERREKDRFVRADGHTDWLRWEMRPWQDEKGAIGGIIMFTEVITERVRNEEAIHESETFLRMSQQAGQCGSWEWELTTNRIKWSDEMCRIHGLAPGAFAGHLNDAVHLVHPDDRASIDTNIRHLRAAGEFGPLVYRIVRPDGTERMVLSRGEILSDASGQPERIIGTVVDITEHTRAEQRLQRVLAAITPSTGPDFFRSLATHLAEVCEVEYALVGIIDHAEPSLVRTIAVSHRGQPTDNFVHDVPGTPCERVIASGLCHYPTEVRREFPRDERLAAFGIDSYMGIPLFTSAGEALGYIALMHDRRIARPEEAQAILQVVAGRAGAELERQRHEQEIMRLNAELEGRVKQRTVQLEEANRELEAFSYSVSHDLRAPLRGINGFASILMSEFGDRLDQTGRDYLGRVQKASLQMAELIDALLGLGRISRTEVHTERQDLSALAGAIVDDLRRAHPGRDVVFTCAEGIFVEADGHLLRILMENLLSNAWKFTAKQEKPRVDVGTFDQNGERVFFVRDNGAGFQMEFAAKLFGPFQRLHGPEEFEGTGIGLVTAQRIVRRHGGRIWPEAEPGKGATFFFTLARDAAALV